MSTLLQCVESLAEVNGNWSWSRKQDLHRQHILRSWLQMCQERNYDIDTHIIGNRVLEIGCGQGDMIAPFAAMLQAQGNDASRVIGVDPASLNYGGPITLGEAQAKLSASSLGQHLSFKQTTAPALVAAEPPGTYSVAYFAHSLYYLPSAEVLVRTLKSLLDAGVQTLLLAEWSLACSSTAALPHLLAVLAQAINPLPEGNIQTVMAPKAYIDAAIRAGWQLVCQKTITPVSGLEDGRWEASIASAAAQKRSPGGADGPLVQARSAAHNDALQVALSQVGLDNVQTMDVWTAVFRPSESLANDDG